MGDKPPQYPHWIKKGMEFYSGTLNGLESFEISVQKQGNQRISALFYGLKLNTHTKWGPLDS